MLCMRHHLSSAEAFEKPACCTHQAAFVHTFAAHSSGKHSFTLLHTPFEGKLLADKLHAIFASISGTQTETDTHTHT